MSPAIRNTLAVLCGVLVGGIVNSAIVNVGPSIIPLPEGADISTMEGLRDSMHLFTFWNHVPPFLAHALGTLVGAFLAVKVAASHHARFAWAIGVFYLIGGIVAAFMIGGSVTFIVVDLVFAYLPMAWLGLKLAGGGTTESA
jgi:uncharacterized membrane protein YhdT